MGNDFDIVLAHRGPWMGLWATIASCEMALKNKPFSYSYIIVANGDKELASDMYKGLDFLRTDKKIGRLIITPHPMSPPSARQYGTYSGAGKYLFFFDNHCLVEPDYFERALTKMNEYGIEMLHSTTKFHPGAPPMYSYKMSLATNFWVSEPYFTAHNKREPYRVAMGGHGGFAVSRKLWEEVGGYWTGFSGYGGEEPYFDLKLWLLGKEVWLDPKMIHHHFPGERGYARHYTDDFYRNMLMCANIIGGEEWVWKLYDSFNRSSKSRGKEMYEILMDAIPASQQHAQQLAAKRVRTLDEQLEWFTANNIPQ